MFGYKDLKCLIDLEGNETCGFVVKDGVGVEMWKTPSLRPSPDSYSIGKNAWRNANIRAKKEQKKIIGTIHTHPNGPIGPSDKDIQVARKLRNGEIRLVWHPSSGTLTQYGKQGIIEQSVIKIPLLMIPVLKLFFV